jgi:transposase
MVEEHFPENLFSGALFIFLNRRRDRVKILYWDRDGLALWHKRLERGKFQMPANKEGTSAELTTAELSMLLEGITPLRVNQRYRLGEARAATG